MRLKDLEQYHLITIQCHDNPDGDAIGAGYALYQYFKDKGKKVRLIYSGGLQIQKTNLVILVEQLGIPIQYVKGSESMQKIEGLLITVDCQYGAGNVTKFEADAVAMIDHHQIEPENPELSEIRPYLGSCSTLVWKMMKEEGFSFQKDIALGTALYYGLYMDTNQFAEIRNPLDMDMREEVCYDNNLIMRLKHSNLSLKEMEIAGIALIRSIYNDDYKYAIIKSQPCDPNLLGLISDFLLQVDAIRTCVVYNEGSDGFKLSVRSCSKEVKASELAIYLTKDIGTGGGGFEKAGGFISKKKYQEKYPAKHTETYFGEKINEYFDFTDVIYAGDYTIDISDMKTFLKQKQVLSHIIPKSVWRIGTPITIRTQNGDLDLLVEENTYIMIGLKGEVYPIDKNRFDRTYQNTKQPFSLHVEYTPVIRNRENGMAYNIMDYAIACIEIEETRVYAKELKRYAKIFTKWKKEEYLSGNPGDFIAVDFKDRDDIYIVERNRFYNLYEEIQMGC